MNLTAFQKGADVRPAERFGHRQPDIWIALGILAPERRNDTFDKLRRSGQAQHAGFSALQQLSAFADGAGLIEQRAAVSEQLLSLARQHEAAARAIEQFQAELSFKVRNLSRKRGLRDAKLL